MKEFKGSGLVTEQREGLKGVWYSEEHCGGLCVGLTRFRLSDVEDLEELFIGAGEEFRGGRREVHSLDNVAVGEGVQLLTRHSVPHL